MSQKHLLPQFVRFDCIDFFVSRAILCEWRRYRIELKQFDPFNRDFRYTNKTRKNSPWNYPSKPVFDKRIFDVTFKLCAKNVEDLEYAICEVEKVLQPLTRKWRVNWLRREFTFCMPSWKRYRGDVIVTDINQLNPWEERCCVDYSATFQLGDPYCQNPWCRTEIDKNGGDAFNLFEEKFTDSPAITWFYWTTYPNRIESIVGDRVTQTQIQYFNDPFFWGRFFQQMCPILYEWKSCTPLSFRLEAVWWWSWPVTFYVFCADGETQAFHIDTQTIVPWTIFSLNSEFGTLTQQVSSPTWIDIENIIPLVDPNFAEFPQLCPMKPFDIDFWPYTLDGVANYLIAVDSPTQFLMSLVYIEQRC